MSIAGYGCLAHGREFCRECTTHRSTPARTREAKLRELKVENERLREAAQAVVDDAHYHVDLQSTPKEVATVASRLLDALAALLEVKK